jgi:hypothetical protein
MLFTMRTLPRLPIHLSRTARSKWLFFFGLLTVIALLDTAHNYVGWHGEGNPISLRAAIEWGVVFWFPFFPVPAAMVLVDGYRLSFERKSSFAIHCVAGLGVTLPFTASPAGTRVHVSQRASA